MNLPNRVFMLFYRLPSRGIKERPLHLPLPFSSVRSSPSTVEIAQANKPSRLQISTLNMLDYRTKNAMAKITVVEKAATDTLEKPFGEAWKMIAKAFRFAQANKLQNKKRHGKTEIEKAATTVSIFLII
ncbi:hypothetical protein BOTNAR_0372g00010 [Botryotinia narcissicola]|uniref:Uncharacterized protein n=1 Tax=Botryotinia narcissicola TaxID=278944 RepID=A0A4Z1HQD9_9HELO|nr:hypothetical protein BOTNAR_0372g00010 [Botryotinia narcissicola]